MTPKEKAEELHNKFYKINEGVNLIYFEEAKQCALIAVDEIMNALPPFDYGLEFVAKIEYWLDVKQEIEKL